MVLDEMLKYAIHTNWGERKEDDSINIIAYYSLDECRFKYKTSRRNPDPSV